MTYPGRDSELTSEAVANAPADAGKNAFAIYVLYLAGIFLALAVITMPIAIGMACFGLSRESTPRWVRTHYWFQLRSVVVFLVSIAAMFAMLPGVAAEVPWAGSVFLAGIVGFVFFIVRCFWGLALLFRLKTIPLWSL